jgi:hypothetical protein
MSRSIKSFTDTFQDDFPTLTPLDSIGPTTTSTSSSDFLGMSWQTWVIIILLLALLGFNIFAYLAKGTQATASIIDTIFGPILRFLGYATIETTKKVVDVGATGAKTGVDIVAGATKGAIDIVDKTVEQIPSPTPTPKATTGTSVGRQVELSLSEPVQKNMHNGGNSLQWGKDSLGEALNDARRQIRQEEMQEIEPDDSSSSIQAVGKSGWCYVGENKGVRSCAAVGVNDVCMSGNIFPTRDVCINPSLRA